MEPKAGGPPNTEEVAELAAGAAWPKTEVPAATVLWLAGQCDSRFYLGFNSKMDNTLVSVAVQSPEKGLQILFSRNQAGPGGTVKQGQEHVK